MDRLRVGIIGIGNISGIYLKNLIKMFGRRIELLGCADIEAERAHTATREYELPKKYGSPEELLRDDDIELVLNLTIPAAHYEVSKAAVDAGKHVYVEKPLCVELSEAAQLLDAAKEKGVRVCGAPDTFLGAAHQTARKLIDDGWIGEPVAAVAFLQNHGHEHWHPNPEFFYKRGGGPMFDMGPYYLTALVNLIGPVVSISGSTRKTFATRTITSEPKYGAVIDVDIPTHLVGILDFANGALGTITTSFDVWAHNLPRIEIYGTDGSLSVPDPNVFGGAVKVRRKNHDEWEPVPLTHSYDENSRGLGVAEAGEAIASGRVPRTDSELTNHVLEIMHGIHIAADSGMRYMVKTPGTKPAALPMEF